MLNIITSSQVEIYASHYATFHLTNSSSSMEGEKHTPRVRCPLITSMRGPPTSPSFSFDSVNNPATGDDSTSRTSCINVIAGDGLR